MSGGVLCPIEVSMGIFHLRFFTSLPGCYFETPCEELMGWAMVDPVLSGPP